MTVVSVLRLRVRDGAGDEFAGRFSELAIFESSHESGGFAGGRLLRDGDRFLVVAEWESRDDYQAWLDNPVRAELGSQIEPLLLDDLEAGEVYEEVEHA